MAIEQLVFERSQKCELFSNPLRTFIALFIVAKEETTWSELKSFLEKSGGSVNPNTLSFHIGRLMETGFINKVKGEGQPRYRVNEDRLSEIEKIIGKDLIEKMREGLES